MTLQVDRINRLADQIDGTEFVDRDWVDCDDDGACEGHVDSFNMSKVQWECGAPACISGHLDAMALKAGDGTFHPDGSLDIGAYLGISQTDVTLIIMPETESAHWEYGPLHPSFISKEMAVAMLRILARTGGVFWAVAREECENGRIEIPA